MKAVNNVEESVHPELDVKQGKKFRNALRHLIDERFSLLPHGSCIIKYMIVLNY